MPDENGGSNNGELNSWKDIADYLGTTVRTAQRWESERRLPVRRLSGARGRVVASVADIDEWKQREALQPVRAWEDPKWLRWYAAGATVLLLLTGGILGANFISKSVRGAPAALRWHGQQIEVLDRDGRQLWTYTFPSAFGGDLDNIGRKRGAVQHVDLDGDGGIETVFAFTPADHMRFDDVLYCFSSGGQLLWKHSLGRLIRDSDTAFHPPYHFRALRTITSPDSPGQRWIVATAFHHLSYMSQTVFLDPNGEVRGEYWHPGHFNWLDVADIDGQPGEEILLGGENRHRGQATVVILDARKLAEEGPRDAAEFDEVRSEAELAVLFFPRTRLNRVLEEINHVGRVQWVGGMIEAQVEEARVQRPSSDLNYVFDRELNLVAIHPWDTIRSSYKEVFGSPEVGARMFEEDLNMVRDNIVVIRGRATAAGR